MAATLKKSHFQTPIKTINHLAPLTPQILTPVRRSSRLISSPPEILPVPKSSRRSSNKKTPKKTPTHVEISTKYRPETPISAKNVKMSKRDLFAPVSPHQSMPKRRKRGGDEKLISVNLGKVKENKRKVYYKKVEYDEGVFEVGDDVYVKRREDAISDEDYVEMDECGICFKTGKAVMIECDDCLGGFHLKCLKPPLKEVPDGDWICVFCDARKLGKKIEMPLRPDGMKRRRTAREKLLSSDLWAARIESLWKEVDGSYWFQGRWYIIPEETAAGRQPHNLRRELYRTNDFADIEMESVIKHCEVMKPKGFAEAKEGDDVFLCEYEYDIHWHSFKRLAEIDDVDEDADEADSDKDWKDCYVSDTDEEDEMDSEDDFGKSPITSPSPA